jgi:glycosyltransferase involved in cell wall biosynthesis
MCLRADVAVRLNRKLRKPSVLGLHQSDLLVPEQLRHLLPSFSALSFRSTPIANQFRERFPAPDLTFTASSGIEEYEILSEAEYLDRRFHRPLRILSVSSLIPLKNIDTVLRALATLPPAVSWTYTVVGDGPERQNLETLRDQLDLRDRVTFLGARPRAECLDLMRRSDVFVLVSSPETFGLVYLEALASGMLVIGCKGTGIDGVIRHGGNGLLCAAGNHAELAQLMLDVFRDGEPPGMRAAAYRTIRDYTIEKRAAKYLQFLRVVTQSPPSP